MRPSPSSRGSWASTKEFTGTCANIDHKIHAGIIAARALSVFSELPQMHTYNPNAILVCKTRKALHMTYTAIYYLCWMRCAAIIIDSCCFQIMYSKNSLQHPF